MTKKCHNVFFKVDVLKIIKRCFTLAAVLSVASKRQMISGLITGGRYPNFTGKIYHMIGAGVSKETVVDSIASDAKEASDIRKVFFDESIAISRFEFVDKNKIHKDIVGANKHPADVILNPHNKSVNSFIVNTMSHASNIPGLQKRYPNIKSYYDGTTYKYFPTQNMGQPDISGMNTDQYRYKIPIIDKTETQIKLTQWFYTTAEQTVFVNDNIRLFLKKLVEHTININGGEGSIEIYEDYNKAIQYRYMPPQDLTEILILLQAVDAFDNLWRKEFMARLAKDRLEYFIRSKALVIVDKTSKGPLETGDKKKHISWKEVDERANNIEMTQRFKKILPVKKLEEKDLSLELEQKKVKIFEVNGKGEPIRHIGDKIDDVFL